MIIEMDKQNKLVCIWLTWNERNRLEEKLRAYYAQLSSMGVKACVFISGEEDLLTLTQELLRHNYLTRK